jgi:DNA modification methylase
VTFSVIEGDAAEQLAKLDADSVQTCITSPPYWGLRDYGTAEWDGGDPECDHLAGPLASDKNTLGGGKGQVGDGYKVQAFGSPFRGDRCGKCGATRIDSQLGLEPTPEQYVTNLVAVFREVRRVLRDDGTVWLNLGDSYASQGGEVTRPGQTAQAGNTRSNLHPGARVDVPAGLKPKDLVGIPWMVAFALRADGWWLRSDIVWAKPNPMPESVTDRPTRSHEYLFLLAKSARYFYDADAIRESFTEAEHIARCSGRYNGSVPDRIDRGASNLESQFTGRNKRSVWNIATQPFPGAHFATFPPKLIEPCVLAGSAKGDAVLDPFCGAGTTGVVALRHDRDFVGIELNPDYAQMARDRIRDDAPLLNGEEAYSAPTPVADKQSATGQQQIGGDRMSGFNERWKGKQG